MDEAIAAGKGRHDLAALGSTSGAQDA
jgi:hypothetical protein